MSHSYKLAFLFCLFCCTGVNAFLNADEHRHEQGVVPDKVLIQSSALPDIGENRRELEAMLDILFTESMVNGILDWASLHTEQASDTLPGCAWLKLASCEKDKAENCLKKHYLNRYLKYFEIGFRLEYAGLLSFGVFAPLVVFPVAWCTRKLFCGTGLVRSSIRNALVVYPLGVISIVAFLSSNKKLIQHYASKDAKISLMEEAVDNCLQCILSLLEKSLVHSGVEIIEEFSEKTESFISDRVIKKEPIALSALADYTEADFSSNAWRLVMLDKNMKPASFFNLFLKTTDSGEMQITLESQSVLYYLKASRFDLTPLLRLMKIIGTEYVQLHDAPAPAPTPGTGNLRL